MGVTIVSKKNPDISCSFSYGTFKCIRGNIARDYNYELGRIYNDSLDYYYDPEKQSEADHQYSSLFQIADSRTKQLMSFLSMSDCNGDASKSICKLLVSLKEKVMSGGLAETIIKNCYEPFFAVIEDGSKNNGIKWY